ncbi:hypothetical protein [Prescottella agglutinans]|uniref:Uncharacterized protein n=1 Tax=Prescottella agglutinans TaxID=1644129 RepID=A0ABT6MAN3_9NOCA|nr:hypothetical protein [Prescottella agglutinans]MDH6281372.1 hypothetical protein [Prescottella agglutinans]
MIEAVAPLVRKPELSHMLATHARPEVAAAITADEENFLDRSRTRMYVVDVRES